METDTAQETKTEEETEATDSEEDKGDGEEALPRD